MAKFTDALKKVVSVAAPTLGTMIGGPWGQMAGRAIAAAVGNEEASEAEVEAALANADPATWERVKAADREMAQFLKRMDIELASLDNADRASARQREMTLKDRTPAVLAGVVTLGFFGVLLWMLKFGLPSNGEQPLLVMLGSLGAAWTGIIAYYYGSSAGSRNKQTTIDAVIGKK